MFIFSFFSYLIFFINLELVHFTVIILVVALEIYHVYLTLQVWIQSLNLSPEQNLQLLFLSYFSFQFCQCLLYIFWGFVVRHMYICHCYLFLMYLPVYHYNLSLFFFSNFSHLEVCLILIYGYYYSYYLCDISSSNLLLSTYLCLWICCPQYIAGSCFFNSVWQSLPFIGVFRLRVSKLWSVGQIWPATCFGERGLTALLRYIHIPYNSLI